MLENVVGDFHFVAIQQKKSQMSRANNHIGEKEYRKMLHLVLQVLPSLPGGRIDQGRLGRGSTAPVQDGRDGHQRGGPGPGGQGYDGGGLRFGRRGRVGHGVAFEER